MTTPDGQPPQGPGAPGGGLWFQKPGTEGGVRFEKPGVSPPAPQFGGPASVLAPEPGPTYDLASWGRRAVAALIDWFVTVVLIVVLGTLLWAAFGALSPWWTDLDTSNDDGAEAFVWLLWWLLAIMACFLVVSLTYAPLWMWRTNGRTLGKQMLGIRVIRADGSPMTFGYAVFREFLVKGLLGAFASSVTVYLYALADALWSLWDSERRAIHDYVASSRVVRD